MNINSLSKLKENFDFSIEAIFKNKAEQYNFLEALKKSFKIRKTQMFEIAEECKREDFLTKLSWVGYLPEQQ